MTKKEDIAAKKAEKKAAKEAEEDEKFGNKLALAKAKNPVPVSYGDSSSALPSNGDSNGNAPSGFPWFWIVLIGIGGFLLYRYAKKG